MHYLLPGYVMNFKCNGCTECCKRWRIIFDKDTMGKYEEIASRDEDFSGLMSQNLKMGKDGQSIVQLKNREVKLSLKSDWNQQESTLIEMHVCPFLSEDGLCVIQKRFGIEALSDTCKIFPRAIAKTERGFEMALTYACATAARTLKNREPVEFYQDPDGFEYPNLNGQYLKIGDDLKRKKLGKTNYFEVEELLIDIMQFRQMDIDTRITLTGIVLDKLKDGDIEGIRMYLRNLDDALINQLKSLPSHPEFMMKLVSEAVEKRLLQGITEKNMSDLLVIVYSRLKLLDEEMVSHEKAQKLLHGYNLYYKPYLEDISHVYENYFVNFVFSKKFYTHKYIDAYFLMVFFYTLIRFFTICVCMAEQRNVDEDMVVWVIHSIDRSIGHNSGFYEDVLRQIKHGDYHRLPYVLSLINL